MELFGDLNGLPRPEIRASEYVKRLVPQLAAGTGITPRRLAEMLQGVPNRAIPNILGEMYSLGSFNASPLGIPLHVAEIIKAFQATVVHYVYGGSPYPEVVVYNGKSRVSDPPPYPEDELVRDLIKRGNLGFEELRIEERL